MDFKNFNATLILECYPVIQNSTFIFNFIMTPSAKKIKLTPRTSKIAPSVQHLLNQILHLDDDWHSAGSFSPHVFRALAHYMSLCKILHSAETGAGKSTLLLSHLSADHKVFVLDVPNSKGNETNTLEVVCESPLFNKKNVEFIKGPTQLTLPSYKFENKLQFVLIDGPHGYPFPDMEYYYFYQHIEEGGLLVIDDIHIPTIYNLFRFLKEDDMFFLVEVVENTAFFRRSNMPTLNPLGDGWWEQKYNIKRFPAPITLKYKQKFLTTKQQVVLFIAGRTPILVRKRLKKILGRK